MTSSSLYETNILNQPSEWKRLLLQGAPIPPDLNAINPKRIFFVGIGSSYWAARFAEFLWREHYHHHSNGTAIITNTTTEPLSVQSFDFVRSKYIVSRNDIVVVFSHRGTKTFSMQALEIAKKHYGATTVLVTGIGSPPNHNADFRIETCAQENCGAFTISLTSAITRIIQWIGLSNRVFLEKFKEAITVIEKQLPFKIQQLPKFPTNLVIVGDLIREIAAREIALKISETSYLPVRSFALEEFLHGPRVTLDRQSSLLIFSSLSEPRRETLVNYANAVGSEVTSIDEEDETFVGIPKEFCWLGQLLWGQQLALELSKELKTNPDTVRGDQYIYKEARNLLTL
jgi:fructoselysine-6-P-deglycase FrlB-like protein